MKKILFVSIDPASASRRMINQINTAVEIGFSPEVITVKTAGITPPPNMEIDKIQYIVQKYKKGILRFLEFNFHLFLLLIRKDFDILFCRGLWVFPAVIPIKLVKRRPIIYDAHEYFMGHTTFNGRSAKREIWRFVEKIAVKLSDALITVSEPIAEQYVKDYPELKDVYVIRNLPHKVDLPSFNKKEIYEDSVKSVVFSGYLLPGRSLHNIIRAFSLINDKNIKLVIIGNGILKKELVQLTAELGLNDSVTFKALLPNHQVIPALSHYDLGLSLIEADCLNRQFALPNKFFEYLSAGLPILASNIITQKAYMERYKVGKTINPDTPETIAKAVREMLSDKINYPIWQKNAFMAANELNWQNESPKLKKIFKMYEEHSFAK